MNRVILSVSIAWCFVFSVACGSTDFGETGSLADSRLYVHSGFQGADDHPDLTTWWHFNNEWNEETPVAEDRVRRSTRFHVKIVIAGDHTSYYDSYAYMTIPRSGMSQHAMGYAHEDGAEFASEAGLTMSWSTFLCNRPVDVLVELLDGTTIDDISAVTIRPKTLRLQTRKLNDRTVLIRIPYVESGRRFSVEFDAHQINTHSNNQIRDGELYVQQGPTRDPFIHREPRHALMVFAEPKLSDERLPARNDSRVFEATPGRFTTTGLQAHHTTVYFGPGTYWMPSHYHAHFHSSIRWIYLAPGAYVKGAFELDGQSEDFRITGYGVLSGENYVYKAHKDNNYPHPQTAQHEESCHGRCLKMLQFFSLANKRQTLTIRCITVAAPPYHSFAAYGHDKSFKTHVEH